MAMKDILKELVQPAVKSMVSSYAQDTLKRVEKTVENTQKKIMRGLLIGGLFTAGIILLTLGIIFLLEELTPLTLGTSFTIVGFAVLFLSMAFMLMSR